MTHKKLAPEVERIEHFFREARGGEFGANARESPFQVIGPKESDHRVLFGTKRGCFLAGLEEFGPPAGVGLIFRYGLPHRDDLPWISRVVEQRELLFLGDLDPTDLLIFAWLRENLSPKKITHFGVNDALLENLQAIVPPSFTIELGEEEVRALSLLDEVFPDLENTVGATCATLLRDRRKIELEAVVSAVGSQTPILKLIAGLPAC